MRAMRDSGLEWLGEIPAEWSIVKGKHVFALLQRPVRDSDGVITCFRDGEVTLRSNRRTEGFTVALKEIGYQGIEPGDLVVHGMDGFAGSIGISDSRGKASPVLNVLDSTQNKKFLMYYLRALAYREVYLALADGIRVRSCNLSWKKIGSLPIALPSPGEQLRIVSYLDEKRAQIDRAIEAAEGSIEEYKAYKESIVSHAVTKGFKSDAKMMESGIEWLGSVPVTWRVRYPKYLFALRKERARANDVMLTASQHHGMIPQERFMAKEAYSPVPVEKGHDILKHVEPGDFVISMRSFQGGLEYSQVRGKMSSAYLALYPISDDIDSSYYRWLFKSPRYIEGLQSTTNLVRDGQALRYANFLQLWLPVPPIDEQQYIADYLDEKCSQIDRAVSAKKAIIEDLKTYKHSLIYEVVTGKREV